jgi:hypothetical protein
MRLAEIPFLVRLGAVALFISAAFSIIGAVAFFTIVAGFPGPWIVAIMAALFGAYMIARLRLLDSLRSDVDPSYVCERCRRRVKLAKEDHRA